MLLLLTSIPEVASRKWKILRQVGTNTVVKKKTIIISQKLQIVCLQSNRTKDLPNPINAKKSITAAIIIRSRLLQSKATDKC